MDYLQSLKPHVSSHTIIAASEERLRSKEFVCSVGIYLVQDVFSCGDLVNTALNLRDQ
jgi:hypothetical protein